MEIRPFNRQRHSKETYDNVENAVFMSFDPHQNYYSVSFCFSFQLQRFYICLMINKMFEIHIITMSNNLVPRVLRKREVPANEVALRRVRKCDVIVFKFRKLWDFIGKSMMKNH